MTNNALSVEQYNRAEEDALALLPNVPIAAFRPVSFLLEGSPTYVKSEKELWKFVESQHMNTFEGDFLNFLDGAISVGEFELLRHLAEKVLRFSQSNYGKEIVARPTTALSINVLRHIEYLFGDERPKVFEIGPGSGYLGALLMLQGYPYAATDVTQGFYLHQNHLWNYITDGKVVEVGFDTGRHMESSEPGGVVHVPWWEFAKTRLDGMPEFDVVTCNHALCEMSHHAVWFTLAIARALLRGNGSPKVFLFEGWGAQRLSLKSQVTQWFYHYNFELVHYDRQIVVFAQSGTPDAVDGLRMPRKTSARAASLRNVWRKIGGMSDMETETWAPCHYVAPGNPLSQAIISGRQVHQQKREIKLAEVNEFYTSLCESNSYLGPDEEFMRFLDA